jgi:hypothetical protein
MACLCRLRTPIYENELQVRNRATSARLSHAIAYLIGLSHINNVPLFADSRRRFPLDSSDGGNPISHQFPLR